MNNKLVIELLHYICQQWDVLGMPKDVKLPLSQDAINELCELISNTDNIDGVHIYGGMKVEPNAKAYNFLSIDTFNVRLIDKMDIL